MYISDSKFLVLNEQVTQNHTISKIVAKAIQRIVLIIMIVGAAFALSKDAKLLDNISVYFPHKWAIFAPISLLAFVVLMFLVMKEKYQRIDYNWLFVLAGGFLLIYLLMLYSRIYPAL